VVHLLKNNLRSLERQAVAIGTETISSTTSRLQLTRLIACCKDGAKAAAEIIKSVPTMLATSKLIGAIYFK
jgi:hypothetical protein